MNDILGVIILGKEIMGPEKNKFEQEGNGLLYDLNDSYKDVSLNCSSNCT